MTDSYTPSEPGGTPSDGAPGPVHVIAREYSERRRRERPEPVERQAPPDDRNGRTYGSGPDGIREAAAEYSERRKPTSDPFINSVVDGTYQDEIKIQHPELVASKNRNTPGADPKLLAQALEEYRTGIQQPVIDSIRTTVAELQAEQQAGDGSLESVPEAQPQAPEPVQQPIQPEAHPAVIAAQQQAYEVERAYAEKIVTGVQQSYAAVQQSFAAAAREFGDIQTPQDWARVQATDPARAQRLLALGERFQAEVRRIEAGVREIEAGHHRWTQRQQAAAQHKEAQFKQFAQVEDAKVFAAFPDEFKNPATHTHFAHALTEVIKSYGIDPHEFEAEYNRNPMLRDARVQRLLFDKAKDHIARQNLAQARARPAVPQVQQPGVARPRGADYSEEIRSLDRRLSQSGNIRDAVKLYSAKRRARNS